MADEKKLRFLMRGIKEELFAELLRDPPKTVAYFVTEASTIENPLEIRAKQYDRNFFGRANVNCIDSKRIPADSLHEIIQPSARDKHWKLIECLRNQKPLLLPPSLENKFSWKWGFLRHRKHPVNRK